MIKSVLTNLDRGTTGTKVQVVQQSLKELALGIERSIEKINEANNAAFESESTYIRGL